MRLVVVEGKGEVALNFMWLPAWLALNTTFKQELEERMQPLLVGKELTEDTLDLAHEEVLNFIEGKFAMFEGLRDYLDSIKFVRQTR